MAFDLNALGEMSAISLDKEEAPSLSYERMRWGGWRVGRQAGRLWLWVVFFVVVFFWGGPAGKRVSLFFLKKNIFVGMCVFFVCFLFVYVGFVLFFLRGLA